jgi:putative PIN family toxin of toxin-antitoxin system
VRLVLDTDVIVAAVRSAKGASRWLFKGALEGTLTAVVSVPLILEYEAVLTRPEHISASGLGLQQVCDIIDALAAVSAHTRLSFRWRPLLADGNDDMVLETAINGGADLLVTFNVRHFGTVGEAFGCRTALPKEAVKLVQKQVVTEDWR